MVTVPVGPETPGILGPETKHVNPKGFEFFDRFSCKAVGARAVVPACGFVAGAGKELVGNPVTKDKARRSAAEVTRMQRTSEEF